MSSKWGPDTASSIISDVLRQEQEHEDVMYASLSSSYVLLKKAGVSNAYLACSTCFNCR